jgi:hypothetical protein
VVYTALAGKSDIGHTHEENNNHTHNILDIDFSGCLSFGVTSEDGVSDRICDHIAQNQTKKASGFYLRNGGIFGIVGVSRNNGDTVSIMDNTGGRLDCDNADGQNAVTWMLIRIG